MNRFVFISVLMMLSLTAAARHRIPGVAVADTSIIPVKTNITGQPLAEKLDPKSREGVAKKGAGGAEKKVSTSSMKSKSGTGGNSAVKAGAGGQKSAAGANAVKGPVGGKAGSTVHTASAAKKTGSATNSAAAKKTGSGKTSAASGVKSGSATNSAATKKTGSATNSTATGKKSGSAVTKATTTMKASSGSNAAKTTAANKTGSAAATSAAKRSPVSTSKNTISKASAAKKTNTKTTAAKKSSVKKASTSYKSSTTKSSSKTSSKSKTRKLRKGIGIELFTPLAFKYAILLDVPVEKVIDNKLLEVLDHWYGTRYRYGGETRKGIDCSAFTQAFMISYYDYELPRTAEEQYVKCKHIKKKKLRQGDLVFFKTRGPKGGISHVGVYLVNNRFVHSATSTGVRISNLNDDYYRAKYAGAGRIR